MRFSPVLSDIIRCVWAMDAKHVASWQPQVNNWLTGALEVEENNNRALLRTILGANDPENPFNPVNPVSSFDDAPENSIAIIALEGPMMLRGGFCSYGTQDIAALIREAAMSKNISGIILDIDTGGGTTDSIVPLVDAINFTKQQNKPIIAYCNTALSAGYRVAAETDMIIASNDMAEFGSIGVFVKFPDEEGYMASQGLKTITVYAPQSTDKNLPYEEALKGNVELLKTEVLSPIADDFQKKVLAARGKKIKQDTPGILAGRVFFAKAQGFDSIANGLIDAIGNLDFAIEKIQSLIPKKQITTNNNQNFFNMNKKQIPVLLSILGYEAIELVENKASISKADTEKLYDNYLQRFGKALMLKGATMEDDGSMTITEKGLYDANAQFVEALLLANGEKAKADKDYLANLEAKHAQEKAELQAQLAKVANEPDVNAHKAVNQAATMGKKIIFVGPKEGINAVDDLHPWNKAALAIANGDRSFANYMMANGMTKDALAVLQNELIVHGTSTLDISQMNTELGAYYIENAQEITDMIAAYEELSKIFPVRSTGIKDELPNLALYASEFLQPRNATWSEKGGFEIQADIIRVKNWQVSHRYTSAQMWAFIESWLASKTTGTDPFQNSLVQWLTAKMITQIMMVERPFNAIRGVYVDPVSGTAGASINSMDGLFINLIKLIRDLRITTFKVGVGNYDLLDSNGNPNANHVYNKVQALIARIPQHLRDAFKWNVYISKDDYRECEKYLSEVVASNANYNNIMSAESYENFTKVPVPNWVNGLIVITLPGNILQGYREKNDDNRIYYDKEKRDTVVFMDGGYVIAPVVSGKKYATLAELNASLGANQRIFTNAEFGPFTPVDMAADEATPSVLVHNVLRTVANSGATEITGIDDAVIGDFIYIIGGSNTNSSQILSTNPAFIGLADDITFSQGVVAKFQCTATDTFTLVALYQEDSVGAVEFAADDVTPSVANGQLFITNAANTGATDITDFDNAVVGVPFKVLGGGGTHASTITKADKFAYISASWTATAGEEIILQKRPDGNFVEVLE